MGKILIVFLCFVIVVVCGNESKGCDQSACQLEFGNRLRELEQCREEFIEFKTHLQQVTAAFARLNQFLDTNGTPGESCQSQVKSTSATILSTTSATTTPSTTTTSTTTTPSTTTTSTTTTPSTTTTSTTTTPSTTTTSTTTTTATTTPIPLPDPHVPTDKTLEKEAIGVDVVNAVIDKIHGSGIFSDDHSFLQRLAYAESQFGQNPETFRSYFHGGIWQISTENHAKTKGRGGQLGNYHDSIYRNFNINWQNTSWRDLRKPLYSGLAARLLLSSFSEPIPQILTRQADFRSKRNVKSRIGLSKEEFKTQIKLLEANQTCTGKMDLLVILDESGSVGANHFRKSLEFVGNLFKSYSTAPRGNVRMGFMTYADSIRNHFRIVNSLSISEIYRKVMSTSYEEGGTNTNEAIQNGIEQFTTGSNGYTERDGVPKIIALFTDGESENGVSNSAKTKGLGITTFAIGIGSSQNRTELKQIANDDESHVFSLENFDALAEFFGRLNSATCAVAQNPEIGANVVDELGHGEKRIYCYAVPSDGITLTLASSLGDVTVYFSYSYKTPSLALNDGVLDQLNNFIPHPSATEVADSVYFKNKGGNCDVYVTIQGVGGPRNSYTVTAQNGYVINANAVKNEDNNDNSVSTSTLVYGDDDDYIYPDSGS